MQSIDVVTFRYIDNARMPLKMTGKIDSRAEQWCEKRERKGEKEKFGPERVAGGKEKTRTVGRARLPGPSLMASLF